MAVIDLWHRRDKTKTTRYGQGLQWRVVVTGHPSKAFRTKAAAKAHELRLLNTPILTTNSDITVDELLDIYLQGKSHLSHSGFNAASNGTAHARRRWAATQPQSIYTHDIQAWISALTVTVDRQTRRAGRDTQAKALAALRGALTIAVDLGIISSNPCIGVNLGRLDSRDPVFLTIEQLRMLAANAHEDASSILFLGVTGIRLGEFCALNVGDIVQRLNNKWRVRIRKSKNGKARDVPVPSSVMENINLDRTEDQPLFPAPLGGRQRRDNWRLRVFNPAKIASNLSELVPHDLRHTAASLMIRSGATVKDVQNALGHMSAKITLDLYAGWWDDTLDDVSDRMNTLITGA